MAAFQEQISISMRLIDILKDKYPDNPYLTVLPKQIQAYEAAIASYQSILDYPAGDERILVNRLRYDVANDIVSAAIKGLNN